MCMCNQSLPSPAVDPCHSGIRVNCNGDICDYAASWSISGDEITFEVIVRTTGWVGIGFSNDQLMVSKNATAA